MKDLLFLHGAMGAQSQFDVLKERLENDFQIHSLDFYGHGRSSFSDNFGIEAFARQTQEYLEQYQLKKCGVFGYSMGGYVALFLEYSKPGTFSRIMTLGTKFNWTPETSRREAEMLNPETILEKVPAYAEQLQHMHGDKWKELCGKTAQMMRYLGDLPLITAETLSKIHIPVRVGLGDQDKMVGLEETVQAFRNLQKGSFLVMPTTPHPIEKVNVDRLAYKIEKFFSADY